MKLPLAGGAYTDLSTSLNAQECLNFYVHIDNKGGKEQLSLKGRDGTVEFADPSITAEVRGFKIMAGVLYVVIGNSVYTCSTAGVLTNISNPGTEISSFATSVYDALSIIPTSVDYASDDTLWVADSSTDKIYNIDTDGTLNSSFATSTFDASATEPTGVSEASDGDLWVCDKTTNKIYDITNTGTLNDSFLTTVYDVSALDPEGLSESDDGTLWSLDSTTNKIYNFRPTEVLIDSFATSVFDASATSLTGMATDPDGTLWVIDSDADKVYNIEQNGTLVSSFATSTYDVSATNSNGIAHAANNTLWVGDIASGKIYNIQKDGTLLSSFSTFTEYGGNFPKGIDVASDGTLWVAHATKIYNIETDGTEVSSFNTSVFDVSATDTTGATEAPDGTLWITDAATNKIYNIENDGTKLSERLTTGFDASANTPTSLKFAPNNTIFFTDSNTDKVYNIAQYKISEFPTSAFDVSATNSTDIDYSNGSLWITDSTTNKIYNVATDGTLINSFATSVFDASATTTQGITQAPNTSLWVVDSNTDKVYNVVSATLSSSSGNIFMETDGTYVVIVDPSDGTGWYVNTGTFSQITDTDFPNASSLTYQDSYFIVSKTDTDEMYVSASADPTSWDALDFASSEGSPDSLVRIKSFNREVWAFGEESLEIFQNTGASTFPFERIPGSYRLTGCVAAGSVAEEGNILFWLGDDRIIYRSEAFQEVPISAPHIIQAVQGYSTVSDAIGYAYLKDGHLFYVLTFPTEDITWCYDMTTDEWWNAASTLSDTRYVGNCHIFYAGKNIIGHYSNGKLLYLDNTVFDDDGTDFNSVRAIKYIAQYPNRIPHVKIELECESGVGTVATNPTIEMDYSDDDGNTWSTKDSKKLGFSGEYNTRQIWRRKGMARNRVYRFTMNDPYKRNLLGLYLNENE